MSPLTFCVLAVVSLLCTASVAAPGPRDRTAREGKLMVGDPAPDCDLRYEDEEKKDTVKLSSFKGQRPVVLVFGSFT